MARTKKLFYKVDCEECRELGLRSPMKDVYYFIKSFGELTMRQGDIAYHLNISRGRVIESIAYLYGRGLINKRPAYQENGGYVYTYLCTESEQTPCTESEQTPVRHTDNLCTESEQTPVRHTDNLCTESEQTSVRNPNNLCTESEQGLNYNVNKTDNKPINKTDIKGGVGAPPEKNDSNNDSKNDSSDTLRVTLPDLVLAVWCERYREDIGTTYVPDHRTLTSDRTVIADAVEKKMAEFGKDASDTEEARQFLGDMIRAMRAASDPWQRDHWTLHTVATQFNELYNRIKNGNKSNNNPKSRISDDYILRTMREAGIDV